MQVSVPSVSSLQNYVCERIPAIVTHHPSVPIVTLSGASRASVKNLLSTHAHTKPTPAHWLAVRRYLTTVIDIDDYTPPDTVRVVLAQCMMSDIVMGVELVAYIWEPPNVANQDERIIVPLFALQHPTHTLPDLLSSSTCISTPITTHASPNGDVSLTYVEEDEFLCVLEKLKDSPTPVEGNTPAARHPPYQWCRTPSRSMAAKSAKNGNPSSTTRVVGDKKELSSPTVSQPVSAKDVAEHVSTLTSESTPDEVTTSDEAQHPSVVTAPSPLLPTTTPSSVTTLQEEQAVIPTVPTVPSPTPTTVPTPAFPTPPTNWQYKTPLDTLVTTIVDRYTELAATQRTRVDLLSKVADTQLISAEFANFSLLECQPDFFATQPAVPDVVLRCRGRPTTGAILKDTFPRTLSLSGVVPWGEGYDEAPHKEMQEVHCEALESIGTTTNTEGVYLRLAQTGFILSKCVSEDHAPLSGVLVPTGLLGNILTSSLAHLSSTPDHIDPKKLELYTQLVEKLLTLPRSITRTSIRKQVKANNGNGFRSLVSVMEYDSSESALFGALAITAFNTVLLREYDTSSRTSHGTTVLVAATFANSIILTHSAATGAVDGSGDSVNIASRAIRCRMPKTFHNVTAIWAQVYGVDALASISPDFTTINENLATIVAAYADSTTPSSAPSTLSTPEERCNDLTVAVVAAAACLLWRVAETVPHLDKMPTTTPEFAEAKSKINDCAKMFNDICECALTAILVEPRESGYLPVSLLACQVSVVGNLQRTISIGPDTVRGRKAKLSLAFLARNLEAIQGGTDLLQPSLPTTTIMGRLVATRSALILARKQSGANFKRRCVSSDLCEALLKTLPYPTLTNPTLTVMKVVEDCGYDSQVGIGY